MGDEGTGEVREPVVPADPHASMRASDHDRDRVAEVLAKAFAEGRLDPEEYSQRLDGVYGARTFGDLEPYTTDLPGHLPARSLAGPAAAPAGSGRTPVSGGADREPAVVAVFGSAERVGHWTMPRRLVATAVLGQVRLDLTHASFAAPEVELVVNSVLGSVQVCVPDDVRLTDAGVAVLGQRELAGGPAPAPGAAPPSGPLLRLSGVSILGSVEVVRTGPSRHPLAGG